ncbi:MAG: Asp-tRNA(Asn)/Glu-tRNA(Gln) amidotransferase subunit GatA [Trueperaceae bacterium]|nr:Asp-tRNA(Asn)/Glu-tRNA(Gln) amidotransferase subunit GatA [Trueperaceae bacterium]
MSAEDPGAASGTVSAHEIVQAVAAGTVRARDVVDAALARADQVQAATNAFTELLPERARAAADRLDAARAAGTALPPLAGVPFVAKANLCVEGVATTAGSAILADFRPPYDATVIARLEAAGAILIGMGNMDEFGMGSSSESSAHGPVRNPWNDARVAGGSSGGPAVAVAAGVVPLALGTDTGGSVRQPAAFCGVLGFKPTYGTLSRHGVIAYGSSLDQVGVLARGALDVGLVMDALVGKDANDATTVEVPPTFAAAAREGGDGRLAGVRVGVVPELSGAGNDPAVARALDETVQRLRHAGAEVSEVHVPSAQAAVACYYLIASAEASSNLARYDGMITGVRVGDDAEGQEAVMTASRGARFGTEVRRRVLMGTFALSAGHVDAWYGRALQVRRKVANELQAAFEQVDLLLTPTVPTAAFRLGERLDDPLAMYLGDVDTCLANLAGVGGISVPAGRDQDGLPLAAQLLAPALQDGRLLRAAAVLARGDEPRIAPVGAIEGTA